jgi:hypothetical protein
MKICQNTTQLAGWMNGLPSPLGGISANLAGGGVGFELRGEKIHLTTEAQRPQRHSRNQNDGRWTKDDKEILLNTTSRI